MPMSTCPSRESGASGAWEAGGPAPRGPASRGDPFLECRLARGEAGDRDAVGGAADVIHPRAVAELDRERLPAVLPADPDLEIRIGSPPVGDCPTHQHADSLLVDGM